MIRKKVKIPLYALNLHIWYGELKEILLEIKKLPFELDSISDEDGGFVFIYESDIYVVFLKRKELTILTQGHLAHEALHVVDQVNTYIDDIHNIYTHQDCYLLQWVVDEINKIIKLK